MKIRTAAITAPGKVELMELQTPELQGREVLVKIHAVALCTLEQRMFKGDIKMPYPCIGGHEAAGEIAAIGPAVNTNIWKIGGRVAVRLLYNCGECHQCRSGHTNMCESAQRKPVREGLFPGPGGICDYVIVSSDALYSIPDSLCYEQAALTEPLSCVVHSVNKAGIKLADDVLVIGGGIMGQLHVMLAKLRGARVILSEIDAGRRALAESFGADATFDPSQCDPVETVRSLTGGKRADVVFNTTPVASVFSQALEMVAKRGTLVQYSSIHPDTPALVSPQLIHNTEITITGSISPKIEDFHTANRLLSEGIVDCSRLISNTVPFEKAQEAFEQAVTPGNFRIVITD